MAAADKIIALRCVLSGHVWNHYFAKWISL